MKEQSKSIVVLLLSIALLLFALPLVSAEVAAEPKPKGTLTVVLPQMAEEGFLPDRCSGSAGPLWEAVYDQPLYTHHLTPQPLKPIPAVVERMKISKDYRTWTFSLRKGIQFHEGWGEVTAEDLKFTVEFNMAPKSRNLRKTEFRKSLKNIEVVDRYTLTFHLKKPTPMFWLLFSTADNVHLPVLCKKYIETVGEEKANRVPIGSGPYRLVEQKVGDYAKFEAYDEHWMLVPEFKHLILRVVPEETTRLAMLKTGEADIGMEMAMRRFPDLEKTGLKPVMSPGANILFIPFGGMLLPGDKRYVEGEHRKDPWADQRVREAMSVAIDRDAINKSIFLGKYTPAPVWVTLPGWEEVEPIPYNPERAKRLLAEAGYPNGFSLKMATHRKRAELPLLAEAVAGYWEAIGIKTKIHRTDYATWRKRNKKGKTAGYVWTHSLSNKPDWTSRLASYGMTNASTPLWQSTEIDEAAGKVRAAVDPEKRFVLYKELGKVYRSIYAHIPLFYGPRLHVVKPEKVGEWHPARTMQPKNLTFVRHPKPLNTFRLFTP